MTQVPVGTNIIIKRARVTLSNNQQLNTASTRVLSRTLINAYRFPSENEEKPPGGFRRIGYKSLTLDIAINGINQSWTHEIGQNWSWKDLTDSEVVGEMICSYASNRPKQVVRLEGLDASVFAKLFDRIRRGPVTAYILLKTVHMQTLSHKDCVGLELRSSPKYLAIGKLTLFRNFSLGDTYRWLLELEGRGRGRGEFSYGNEDYD